MSTSWIVFCCQTIGEHVDHSTLLFVKQYALGSNFTGMAKSDLDACQDSMTSLADSLDHLHVDDGV